MLDKALVLRDDKDKFKDLGDVLAVARSQGKILFRTKENVFVKRLFRDFEFGWIAVVSLQPLNFGCSNSAGCKLGEKRNEK
jgi:hypothetical protein